MTRTTKIIKISDTVQVTVTNLDDGRIHYQLESSLFGRWIPCGETIEYTNVPADTTN